MFIQMKTIQVEEGHSEKLVERFAGAGVIEQQLGFLDLSILKKKQRKGNEEVIIMIRWESEEAWKAWEKSDVHLAGHRENRGKPGPSFILDSKQEVFYVLGQKGYVEPVAK